MAISPFWAAALTFYLRSLFPLSPFPPVPSSPLPPPIPSPPWPHSSLLYRLSVKVSLKTGLDNARSRIQQACVDIIRGSRGGGYSSSPYMAPGAQQQARDFFSFSFFSSSSVFILFFYLLYHEGKRACFFHFFCFQYKAEACLRFL